MRLRKFAVAVGVLALLAAPVRAQSVSFETGTVFTTTGLTGFSTTGALMVGMEIYWSYVGGGGGSGVWGDLGGGLHGVSAGNFSLSMGSGTNTFGGLFTLANLTGSALATMTMDGTPGRTIFDCDWQGSACGGPGGQTLILQGTPGSADGWTAETAGGTYAGPVSVLYTNAIAIGANAPVGDLFGMLIFSFGTDGMASGLTYQFIADTDNSPFDAPPPTPIDDSVVPEPATMVLMATGLAGLAFAQRRRKKQQG